MSRMLATGLLEEVRQKTDEKTGEVTATLVIKEPSLENTLRVGNAPLSYLDKANQPEAVSVWVNVGVVRATGNLYYRYDGTYDGQEIDRAKKALAVLKGVKA